MTHTAADFLLAKDRPAVGRFVLAAALIAGAHVAIVGFLLYRSPPKAPEPEALSATLIDLAPPADEPAAQHAADATPETQPAPDVKPEVTPQPPVEQPPEPTPPPPPMPIPEVPVAPKPEAVLAPPPPPPPPPKKVVKDHQPKKEQVKRAAKPPSPHPEREQRRASSAAAERQGQGSSASSAASSASWKSALLALIRRSIRYPSGANGERGSAAVAFTMDRSGRVLSASLARSSGSSVLDDEAVQTLRRIGSLPAPPSDIAGGRIALTVPITFNVR